MQQIPLEGDSIDSFPMRSASFCPLLQETQDKHTRTHTKPLQVAVWLQPCRCLLPARSLPISLGVAARWEGDTCLIYLGKRALRGQPILTWQEQPSSGSLLDLSLLYHGSMELTHFSLFFFFFLSQAVRVAFDKPGGITIMSQ